MEMLKVRKKHDRMEMLKVKHQRMLVLECQMKGHRKLEPIWNNHSPTEVHSTVTIAWHQDTAKKSQELVYGLRLLTAFLGWSTMPSRENNIAKINQHWQNTNLVPERGKDFWTNTSHTITTEDGRLGGTASSLFFCATQLAAFLMDKRTPPQRKNDQPNEIWGPHNVTVYKYEVIQTFRNAFVSVWSFNVVFNDRMNENGNNNKKYLNLNKGFEKKHVCYVIDHISHKWAQPHSPAIFNEEMPVTNESMNENPGRVLMWGTR